ncbi:hypothetical protein HKD37_15G043102 [Glycine soja]
MVQIWPWKTPPPPLNDRPMVMPINKVFHPSKIAEKKLSLCPLGNNLVNLGLHGEQFQKIIRNFFSSILSVHMPKKLASEKGGCMHTSGSISLQYHAIRLSEDLGRSVYVDEVFIKLIYERILVNLSMIDLGRHM